MVIIKLAETAVESCEEITQTSAIFGKEGGRIQLGVSPRKYKAKSRFLAQKRAKIA